MYLGELNHLSDIEGNHNFFLVFKSSVVVVLTNVCLWRRSSGIYVAVSLCPQLSLHVLNMGGQDLIICCDQWLD